MQVVSLSQPAHDVIAIEARSSVDGLETGGILLGHDRGSEMHVTIAGDAGPAARRERHRFLRDLDHARALADEAYDDHGGVWIGEWHTHPKGPPTPSAVDLRTYATHLADPTLGFERFLSLIVLPCPDHAWQHVSVVAWVMEGDAATIAEIRTEAADD
jgi:integrative and conjugative element protein (TIGR02256 family)